MNPPQKNPEPEPEPEHGKSRPKSMVFTVYQADTWFALTEDQRHAVQEWIERHGIDLRTLHFSEPVVVKDGMVHYTAMTIEAVDGKNMRVKGTVNEHGEMCPIGEERSVPLLAPPPGSSLSGR